MGLLSSKLDRLEARLQALIEGHLARLLPVREYRDEFIQRLISAMKNGTLDQAEGYTLAPDAYVLLVHPDLVQGVGANQQLLKDLAAVIRETGENAGLVFLQPPQVSVASNTDVAENTIEVVARISLDLQGMTSESTAPFETYAENLPPNAFLIVNGLTIYPLERSVINIGRRSDNDLVIDDPRISRVHAQLRAVRGKYVLSDIGSLGGTFVNGERVTQRMLHPRDVISLAGLPLVYGQDPSRGAGLGQTQQMDPAASRDGDQAITKDNVP